MTSSKTPAIRPLADKDMTKTAITTTVLNSFCYCCIKRTVGTTSTASILFLEHLLFVSFFCINKDIWSWHLRRHLGKRCVLRFIFVFRVVFSLYA